MMMKDFSNAQKKIHLWKVLNVKFRDIKLIYFTGSYENQSTQLPDPF